MIAAGLFLIAVVVTVAVVATLMDAKPEVQRHVHAALDERPDYEANVRFYDGRGVTR